MIDISPRILNSPLIFMMFFCTMNTSSQLHHSLYTTMLLDIKTFFFLSCQLKLQIEAQTQSGVWEPGDEVSPESEGDNYAPRAGPTGENFNSGYKTYGALRFCS